MTRWFRKLFGTFSYATNTTDETRLEIRELHERAGFSPIYAPQRPPAYNDISDDDEDEEVGEEEEISPARTRRSRFTSSTHRRGRAMISDDEDADPGEGGDIPWDEIDRESI